MTLPEFDGAVVQQCQYQLSTTTDAASTKGHDCNTREIISSQSSKGKKHAVVRATKGTESAALKAISVWINKPHVANRRLCGAQILLAKRFSSKDDADKAIEKLRSSPLSVCGLMSKDEVALFEDLSEEEDIVVLVRELIPKSEFFSNILELVVFDRETKTVRFIPLPGSEDSSSHNKVKTQEVEYSLQFRKTEEDDDMPSWSQVNELILTWYPEVNQGSEVKRQVTSEWMQGVLLDKLVNWSQVSDISTASTSLCLVPVDRYKETYTRLKNMYGKDLVKNWTERTDPKKYVYEDVAIAAYLLLVWEDDRRKKGLQHKQSFVDLGCGNGLLVYILTKEGHKGLGIDMRRRNIWDTFGEGIDLKEQTITPSGDHIFPQYDWILGNHSDELTPWIPVIAARSSYQCCFFVLPCCPHDFVGRFCQPSAGKSQYGAYLDHVDNIITHCGFHPEGDTLRIPSTKRVCFIGRERSYNESVSDIVDRDRQIFIDKCIEKARVGGQLHHGSKNGLKRTGQKSGVVREGEKSGVREEVEKSGVKEGDESLVNLKPSTLRLFSSDSGLGSMSSDASQEPMFVDQQTKRKLLTDGEDQITDQTEKKLKKEAGEEEIDEAICGGEWTDQFKPRVEASARNCQRVPKETKIRIVCAVFEKVLDFDPSDIANLADGRTWRRGGSLPLKDAVPFLDRPARHHLKAECGGLQTLLRNHSHIFQVTGGEVRLRDFSQPDPWKGRKARNTRGDKGREKTTACWFYDHHPDGCPRDTKLCKFAHGEAELRMTSAY